MHAQVVSRLWQYIKEHNLQDPDKKSNIIPDEKMLTIFTAPLNQFSMNKQLTKHILPKGEDVCISPTIRYCQTQSDKVVV